MKTNVSPGSSTSHGKNSSSPGLSVLSVQIEDYKSGLEKFAAMFSGNYGVKLIFKGTQAYTTGKMIVVPELTLLERANMTPKEVKEALDYLTCTRGFVYHEGAHIIYSDFSHAVAARITKKRGGKKYDQLIQTLEDMRIENKISQIYPGAREVLSFTRDFVNVETKKVFDQRAASGEPFTMYTHLIYAISLLGNLHKNGREHALWKTLALTARRKARELKELIQQAREANTTLTMLDIADEIWKILHEKEDEKDKPPPDENGSDGDDDKEDEKEPKKKPKKKKSKSKKKPKKEKADEKDEASEDSDEDTGDGEKETDSSKSETDSDDSDSDDERDNEEGDGGGSGSGEDGDETDTDDADTDGDSGSGDDRTDESDDDSEGSAKSGEDSDTKDGEASSGSVKKSRKSEKNDEELSEESEVESADGGTDPFKLSDRDSDEEIRDTKDALTEKVKASAEKQPAGVYRVFSTEQDYVGPPPGDGTETAARREFVKALDDETRSVYGPLRRNLENILKARTQTYHVRGLEEGELDQNNLHTLAQAYTHKSPQLRQQARHIFSQKVRTLSLEDTVVSLTVDKSGSMGGCGRGGYGGEPKERLAMKCSDILGQALDGVQVPFELTCWTTQPTDFFHKVPASESKLYTRFSALQLYVLKTFNDSWKEKRSNLSALRASGCNLDGESIWIAAARLIARPEKRKVLFVLSDGMPSGEGYDNTDAVIKHLHQTVARIRAAGVELYAVGISAPEVEQFYKPNFVNVNNAKDLPPVMIQHLKTVLHLT